jgi:methylenetetrahydrofolate dehydrogenase (NADP+)/methenyltetrahydrofolate cyclohydrolase/formyltetrahydrofolate synthetase
MTAQKLDGTAIAKAIREKLNGDIQQKQQTNPRYKPSLVIIQGIFTTQFSFSFA